MEIDRISEQDFKEALLQLNIFTRDGWIDEKILYKYYKTVKDLYSSNRTLTYASLDEYILKRIIVRAIPDAKISQQFKVKLAGSSRPKTVDFKIETPDKTVFIEFDGPTHYVPQYGQVHTSDDKKKAVEDATGYECVIWPYWIQRCERNVHSIFDRSIHGLGALWSTKYFFGSFTIPNASQVIVEETKRFNAINPDGIGYFYGANSDELRSIVPHSIIKKILKNPTKLPLLIPKDWDGDKRYWLPQPLWSLL